MVANTYDPSDEEISKLATWLLVFANVDDLAVLDDFWPLDGPGCVLFTGRDPLAKGHGYLATHGIDLVPFTDEEASELFMKLTKKDDSEERQISKNVAKRLGGIPLAMTQMAGVIIRRDLTFSDFSGLTTKRRAAENYSGFALTGESAAPITNIPWHRYGH